jgi:hypothetical protein
LSSSPIIDFTGYRHNETTTPSVISLLFGVASLAVVGLVQPRVRVSPIAAAI